jgi:site-specific DNA-methyltransferase (adenine-specific)
MATGAASLPNNSMYQLHQGDCLAVMPTLPAKSVELVITDLPYAQTACAWDRQQLDIQKLWAEWRRLLTPTGVVVLTGKQPFSSMLVASNPAWFRYEIIWAKTQGTDPLRANQKPLSAHENILIFSPVGGGRHTYNPQFEQGKPYSVAQDRGQHRPVWGKGIKRTRMDYDGRRYPKTVLTFKREVGQHPTQKPTALLEWLIRTYSNAGQTVLDATMGSGSCGVAALNTGRRFIGIELDPDYYTTAQRRLQALAPANTTAEATA